MIKKIYNWIKEKIIWFFFGGLVLAAGLQGQPTDMTQMYNNAPDIQAKYEIEGDVLRHNSDLDVSIDDASLIIKDFRITPKGYNTANGKETEIVEDKITYKTDGADYRFYEKSYTVEQPSGHISETENLVYEQEIILDSYTTSTFLFDIETNYLYDNGTFYSEEELEEKIYKTEHFRIGDIIAFDDNGDKVTGHKEVIGNQLVINIDDEWMRNAVYPVIIDPSYTILTGVKHYHSSNGNRITRTSDGTIWAILWYDNDYLRVASTTDEGVTWISESVAANAKWSFAITADTSDNIHIAYVDSSNDIAYRKRISTGWQAEEEITDSAYNQSMVCIDTDSDDNPHISWSGTHSESTTNKQLRYIKYNGSSWGSIADLTTDTGTSDIDNTMLIDDRDYVHIVFHKNADDYYYYLENTGSWQTEEKVSANAIINPASIGLGIDSNRYIHTCYTEEDLTNDNIVYRKKTSSWQAEVDMTDGSSFRTYCDLAIRQDDTIDVVYSGISTESIQDIFYQYYDTSWSSEVSLTSSYLDRYSNLIYKENDSNKTISGYGLTYIDWIGSDTAKYYKTDSVVWQSTDNPITTSTIQTVDLTSPTSTAWMGEDWATATPVDWDRENWLKSFTTFTVAETGLASTTNTQYATTSASTTYANWEFFGQIVQDFEFTFDSDTRETLVNKLVYHYDGYSTVGHEAGMPTSTAPIIAMYLKDYTNGSYAFATSIDVSNCSTTACTGIDYTTTTNITNYIGDDKQVGYIVQKLEAYSDCSSTTLARVADVCAKPEFASTTDDTMVAIGCTSQEDTEDVWSACGTGGCYTGLCNGVGGDNPAGPYSCGIYADGGQNACAICNYCPGGASASTSCTVASTVYGVGPNFGCTGDCNTCLAGACNDVQCEGLQCGCTPGETCVSGTCTAAGSDCFTLCTPQSDTCVPDAGTCGMMGGSPAGASTDCGGGTPECCCGL